MRVARVMGMVVCLIPAGAAVHSADAAPKPDSPAAAVRCLARAYSDRSLASYASLLTADYRYHFSESESRLAARYPDGLTREAELEAAANLFGGSPKDGGNGMPAAATIRATAEGLAVGSDPEHPDSTRHYRVVAARSFGMTIRTADGQNIVSTPSLHVFHVVRGDAAVRAAGQPADSSRWYIRRWLEDVSGITELLAAQKQDCPEPAPRPATPVRDEGGAAAPGAPAALAIHPLGNPACPALAIQCDFPGAEPAWVEVFDVTGRLMNRRDLKIEAPGTVSVEAGAGARLDPGVYWVRLSQSGRRPSTKMVVVTAQ